MKLYAHLTDEKLGLGDSINSPGHNANSKWSGFKLRSAQFQSWELFNVTPHNPPITPHNSQESGSKCQQHLRFIQESKMYPQTHSPRPQPDFSTSGRTVLCLNDVGPIFIPQPGWSQDGKSGTDTARSSSLVPRGSITPMSLDESMLSPAFQSHWPPLVPPNQQVYCFS